MLLPFKDKKKLMRTAVTARLCMVKGLSWNLKEGILVLNAIW